MDQPTLTTRTTADDVRSIDAIVSALYETISGPAGERDWFRLRYLFLPQATLASTTVEGGRATLNTRTVEQFVETAGAHMREHDFFEREIARRVERFGHIAHVFSTYDSRHTAEDKTPFARGINSIQLLNDGKRWWIVTVYWDSERPDNPLPPQYLPAAK